MSRKTLAYLLSRGWIAKLTEKLRHLQRFAHVRLTDDDVWMLCRRRVHSSKVLVLR